MQAARFRVTKALSAPHFERRGHPQSPWPAVVTEVTTQSASSDLGWFYQRPSPSQGARHEPKSMPPNPRKRLEKLEQQLAEIKRPESPAKCNCKNLTFVASAEYFKAEMNQTCPVHGFRRLGKINVFDVQILGANGNVTTQSQGVPELVDEYERRLARHLQQMLEEDDPEDL